jgi:hypothetical protein
MIVLKIASGNYGSGAADATQPFPASNFKEIARRRKGGLNVLLEHQISAGHLRRQRHRREDTR